MTIRIKNPDLKKAESILLASNREFIFTLSLKLIPDSTNTIIRNIYESFRMLGEALLVFKGIEAKEHFIQINELISLKVNTPRPLNLLDNLRKLRHSINYYGYWASIEEAQDTIDFANGCFEILYREIKSLVDKKLNLA
jgi:hypothetical protein